MERAQDNIPRHPIAPRVGDGLYKPHIGPNIYAYRAQYNETVGPGSDQWWARVARETLYWDRPFQTIRSGGFETADIAWFPEGALNAAYNCVDRWAFKHPDKTALIYEADNSSESRNISYAALLREVCRVANVLKGLGVRRGDIVSVCMPMTWYAVAACLGCARIGAIHSVFFCGLPKKALHDRFQACKPRIVITSDETMRKGKAIPTKKIVDAAVKDCPSVEHILVLKRSNGAVPWTDKRDLWWHEETAKVPNYCSPEIMASEDPLFIIYTSGTTGKPKGIVHATGGYLLCAALTIKYAFDVHPDDKFCCMADISWMVGHTCTIYGPLCAGITATVFESTPTYPNLSRYWDTVDKHKITHFYSTPSAVRLLCAHGSEYVERYDLSSLRVLGTVGESISTNVWNWYNEHVGRRKCAVLDTYGQTETGCPVLTPFPGAIQTKPGCVTVPFFGQEPAILDPITGKELNGNNVTGVLVLKAPFPSIARTIYQDHEDYVETYTKPYRGMFYTGDNATRDEDGYFWINGRHDDVINIGGHRVEAGEIELVLMSHDAVTECAVVGKTDTQTGQIVCAFIILTPGFSDVTNIVEKLKTRVDEIVGLFARPKNIYIVHDLPRNCQGKVIRTILRKIVSYEEVQLGDLSFLDNPGVIKSIEEKVQQCGN